jgi:hypothetical protein
MSRKREIKNLSNERPEPEFSRLIDPQRLRKKASRRQISADADERQALGERFGLESLDLLEADLTLEKILGGLKVSGEIRADYSQRCVVSLELLPKRICETFAEVYRSDVSDGGAYDWDGAADMAELDLEGKLDLGEMLAQELSGLLDPYPHAPGVHFNWESADEAEDEAPPEPPEGGPFSALAKLKGRGQ